MVKDLNLHPPEAAQIREGRACRVRLREASPRRRESRDSRANRERGERCFGGSGPDFRANTGGFYGRRSFRSMRRYFTPRIFCFRLYQNSSGSLNPNSATFQPNQANAKWRLKTAYRQTTTPFRFKRRDAPYLILILSPCRSNKFLILVFRSFRVGSDELPRLQKRLHKIRHGIRPGPAGKHGDLITCARNRAERQD